MLTYKLQQELNLIESLKQEIDSIEEENNSLKEQAEEANINFSNRYSQILGLELHLDKLKKDLLKYQSNVK
jgi:hypothetical protein